MAARDRLEAGVLRGTVMRAGWGERGGEGRGHRAQTPDGGAWR